MKGETMRVMKGDTLYHGENNPVDTIRFDASTWKYYLFGGEIVLTKK